MLDLLKQIERRTEYLEKYLPKQTANLRSFTEHPDAKRLAPTPLEWAQSNRRIDDRPFSLERFPCLREVYDDPHKSKVIKKPAQRGVSEMGITWAMHALDCGARYWNLPKSGLNVGYLFPTQAALSDFSKERISNLKTESDYLAKLFEGNNYDDVMFKQVGGSYLYLRGAWSKAALKSFPADMLIFDEYDEMEPGAISLARKRMNASLLKVEIKISTPTLPGRGIDAEYKRSDQRVWETKCADCGEYSELDWFRDVRADGESWENWRSWSEQQVKDARITVHCPNCRAEVDRCGPGRWRAKEPHITVVRGYQIPWWPFPFVSLNDLARNAISTDPTEIEEFYRSDLGLAYEPCGSRITDAMMQSLTNELPKGKIPEGLLWSKTTMGVDVGSVFNYRISSTGADGHRYVRAVGTVKTWNELSLLMEQYRVRLCVVDAMPELHGSKAFSAKHKGRVLRALYPNSQTMAGQLYRRPAEADDEKPGKPKKRITKRKAEDGNADVVQVNRTMAMDLVFDTIAEGRERWPLTAINTPDLIAQMVAPVRVRSTDSRGQDVATWEHTLPDHYFHACVYDLIAQRLLPKALGGIVSQGSARGWNP